jgi:hypothetical protein
MPSGAGISGLAAQAASRANPPIRITERNIFISLLGSQG